jgi:hypothetical protein
MALLIGCSGAPTMQTSGAGPVVPYVPQGDWTWPLLPTADGWLVGGSGYVSGFDWPVGVSPGLGLGALLIPSHPTGRLWGFAGELPPPQRYLAPRLLWPLPTPSGSPAPRPSAASGQPTPAPGPTPLDLTGPLAPAWTKAGPSLVSLPQHVPWPPSPWTMSPWGPVAMQPGPRPSGVPLLDLGFPPADGMPEMLTYGVPWFFFGDRGPGIEVVVLDLISRTVFRPPTLQGQGMQIVIDYLPPMALAGPAVGTGHVRLIDLLTGSEDPLPEIPPIDAATLLGGAHMTQYGEAIVFATNEGGRHRIHLFDRRTRQTLRLERLNLGRQLDNPAIDWFGSCILATAAGADSDVVLYDTRTGLVDPLPGVNTPANEETGDLTVNGEIIAYTTDAPGHREARLYDRRTGTIDTLPDVNRLGPIVTLRCSNDAALIVPIYVVDRQLRIAIYDRHTGMIDPLPALNRPGLNILP